MSSHCLFPVLGFQAAEFWVPENAWSSAFIALCSIPILFSSPCVYTQVSWRFICTQSLHFCLAHHFSLTRTSRHYKDSHLRNGSAWFPTPSMSFWLYLIFSQPVIFPSRDYLEMSEDILSFKTEGRNVTGNNEVRGKNVAKYLIAQGSSYLRNYLVPKLSVLQMLWNTGLVQGYNTNLRS